MSEFMLSWQLASCWISDDETLLLSTDDMLLFPLRSTELIWSFELLELICR